MNLRTMVFPTRVRAEVLKLLASIEVADSAQGVNMASQRAEGFVLGLETASAFKADVIEALYVGFDKAIEERIASLRKLTLFHD